jgi:hypothetical protein
VNYTGHPGTACVSSSFAFFKEKSLGARFIFCDLITHGRRLSDLSLPFAKGYRAAKVDLYLSIYSPTCRSLALRLAGSQASKPTHLFSKRKAMFAITR